MWNGLLSQVVAPTQGIQHSILHSLRQMTRSETACDVEDSPAGNVARERLCFVRHGYPRPLARAGRG